MIPGVYCILWMSTTGARGGEMSERVITPAGNLDGMDEYVGDLTVKRIPDATHWVVHEQPDAVNGFIRDFVKQL